METCHDKSLSNEDMEIQNKWDITRLRNGQSKKIGVKHKEIKQRIGITGNISDNIDNSFGIAGSKEWTTKDFLDKWWSGFHTTKRRGQVN